MDFSALTAARVVDLSLTVSERLPGTWPGHMIFAHHNWNWFAEVDGPTGKTRSSAASYQTNFIVMDEHCGTHFDAPTHFVPPPDSGLDYASQLGAQNGDKVPLEDLMGPAAVVDVSFLAGQGEPGVSPFIEPEHVQTFEEEHGELQRGRGSAVQDRLGPLLRGGRGRGEIHERLARHGRFPRLARPLA